jgi:sugar phosphate isomerase/epimerase
MIQFSCADYTFPLLPRAKRLALLALLGFRYVDLGLFERSLDLRPSQLAVNPKGFIKRLQSDLRVSGLKVSDVFLQTGVEPAFAAANDPSSRVRAHNRKLFLRTLDLCSILACTHLTGLPGVWHTGVTKADDFALAREEAVWRQQTAARAGVQYAIEAHIGSLCADVAGARSFIESLSGLTLTLDYGHFVAAGTASSDVHPLLPFASHIHARAGMPDRLQATLSENKVDFAGMVHRLRQQKYRGFFAIEYVWTDWGQCNRADNVSETLLLRKLLQDLAKNGHKVARKEKTNHV